VNTFSPKLFAAWKRKEAPALVNKKGDEAALYLYDVIGSDPIFGGIAAKDVVAALQDASSSKSLTVFINSIGGDFFEGKAIYAALARFAESHKVTAVVDGLAASAASLIAMAAPRVEMAPDATMMVHEVHGGKFGRSSDLRALADMMEAENATLTGIYQRRTGIDGEKIASMLAAETWLTASQAVEQKFADAIYGQASAGKPVKNEAPKFLALAEQTQKRITEARIAIDRMDMAVMKNNLKTQ
jgi:ATP-dependent Clp protease, protease subunit